MKIKLFIAAFILASFCRSADAADRAAELKIAADAALRSGRVMEATRDYQEALALNPAFKEVHFNLAVAHYTAGRLDEAANSLEDLVRLSPNDTEALYNLGCLRLCLGDAEASLSCFQKANLSGRSDPRFRPLIEDGVRFLFSRLILTEAPSR